MPFCYCYSTLSEKKVNTARIFLHCKTTWALFVTSVLTSNVILLYGLMSYGVSLLLLKRPKASGRKKIFPCGLLAQLCLHSNYMNDLNSIESPQSVTNLNLFTPQPRSSTSLIAFQIKKNCLLHNWRNILQFRHNKFMFCFFNSEYYSGKYCRLDFALYFIILD